MKHLDSLIDAWRSQRIGRPIAAVLGLALITGLGSVALRAVADRDTQTPAARARQTITEAIELADRMSIDANGRFVAYSTEWGEPSIMLASLEDDGPAVALPVHVPYPCRPSLSPDGRRVAFTSCYGPDHRSELYVHDVESGVTRRVYRREHGERWWWQPPAWTPDGTELVIVHYLPPDGAEAELRRLDPDTSKSTLLVQEPGAALRAPAFSPQGDRMAYFSGAHLRVMDIADGTVTTVRGAHGNPSPSRMSPDPPAWSADGRRLAHGRVTPDGYDIWISDLDTGQTRRVSERGIDSFRPIWTPSGDGLVYLRSRRSARTLWLHSLDTGGHDTPIGFDTGVTYRFGFDRSGRLLALVAPPERPRTLYWVPVEARGRPTEFRAAPPFDLDRRWVSFPTHDAIRSADGLHVPLIVFPRTCGDATRPGPGLVFVHHRGGTDTSPRWSSELQYVAAAGLTIVGVNYRGSTGNGRAFAGRRDDIDGQIDDIAAAIAYARQLPAIDADQLYVMAVSSAAPLAYAAIERSNVPVRGVIDWVGATGGWTTAALQRQWPSMLWVSALDDRSTVLRKRIVARLAERTDNRIRHAVVPGDHNLLVREGRRQALDAVAEFVERTSEGTCETAD
jgi:Tol biopolymer transport system component/dienelactone hydrolase